MEQSLRTHSFFFFCIIICLTLFSSKLEAESLQIDLNGVICSVGYSNRLADGNYRIIAEVTNKSKRGVWIFDSVTLFNFNNRLIVSVGLSYISIQGRALGAIETLQLLEVGESTTLFSGETPKLDEAIIYFDFLRSQDFKRKWRRSCHDSHCDVLTDDYYMKMVSERVIVQVLD